YVRCVNGGTTGIEACVTLDSLAESREVTKVSGANVLVLLRSQELRGSELADRLQQAVPRGVALEVTDREDSTGGVDHHAVGSRAQLDQRLLDEPGEH